MYIYNILMDIYIHIYIIRIYNNHNPCASLVQPSRFMMWTPWEKTAGLRRPAETTDVATKFTSKTPLVGNKLHKLPSGKHRKHHGKSPFLMGKLVI
jgi:hypothetical protein